MSAITLRSLNENTASRNTGASRADRGAGLPRRRDGAAAQDRRDLRRPQDRRADLVSDEDSPTRMRAVGDRGAEHDDVGNNPETLAREGRAGVPEPRGFVEYEQKPVRVADRTKAIEIALRRHQHAGADGERLEEAGRDPRAGTRHRAPEILGARLACRRLPARETVFGKSGVA